MEDRSRRPRCVATNLFERSNFLGVNAWYVCVTEGRGACCSQQEKKKKATDEKGHESARGMGRGKSDGPRKTGLTDAEAKRARARERKREKDPQPPGSRALHTKKKKKKNGEMNNEMKKRNA